MIIYLAAFLVDQSLQVLIESHWSIPFVFEERSGLVPMQNERQSNGNEPSNCAEPKNGPSRIAEIWDEGQQATCSGQQAKTNCHCSKAATDPLVVRGARDESRNTRYAIHTTR